MYENRPTFTVDQLAKRWQTSTRTIYRRMDDGSIRFFRVGSKKLISLAEVERIEQGEPVPAENN